MARVESVRTCCVRLWHAQAARRICQCLAQWSRDQPQLDVEEVSGALLAKLVEEELCVSLKLVGCIP